MQYPQTKFDPKWIESSSNINDEVIEWAKSFGKFLTEKEDRGQKDLSTSQIRRFFGDLKRIQSDFQKHGSEVPMIKAKLAYAVGRDMTFRGKTKSKIDAFYEQLDRGLSAVNNDEEKFKNFVKIVEAIVAFHKFHGGRDN